MARHAIADKDLIGEKTIVVEFIGIFE